MLLQPLGYVAGHAAACGMKEPAVAARVAIEIADKVGSDDEASHQLVTDFALLVGKTVAGSETERLEFQ